MRTEKAGTERLYTYEDYLKIDDDNQYELIGGRLILVPTPRTIHQELSGELYSNRGAQGPGSDVIITSSPR
ncbi:hypothetical protein CEB3_c46610 [Peptococcaceae bacterium CEB3]|nr:hypothetical protein CEB3_c46610 [Peptococcaceae bacterium CEB3]